MKPMNMPRAARQAGFTLIELMVALAIGLLIVAALVALLLNLSRNNNELSKTNRMIENGRFAVQLLEGDLVHAGFWGGFVPRFDDLVNLDLPDDVPNAVPNPCTAFGAAWTDQYKSNLIGIPVQSYDVPAVVPSPPIPVCAAAAGDPVENPRGNSDVLVIRYAEKCTDDCLTVSPLVAGRLYFQAERCGDELPDTLAAAYRLDQTGFTLQTVACTPGVLSDIREFVSHIYYVRDINGLPTLMRSRMDFAGGAVAHQPAEAMIEGIESMRVEYGVDNVSDSGAAVNYASAVVWADPENLNSPTNRGDGVPDAAYIRCTAAVPCTADQLMNAVSVKLHLLVRADTATPGYVDTKTYNLGGTSLGPFNDNFKRHVFTQTIRLTNVSSRRETP